MNVLVIGDMSQPGAGHGQEGPAPPAPEREVDYCVANVENAAGGFGVTKESATSCSTRRRLPDSGNHVWDKKEILGWIDLIPQLLRPTTTARAAGRVPTWPGTAVGGPVATLNLSGRVFMNGAIDDPFHRGWRRWRPGQEARS